MQSTGKEVSPQGVVALIPSYFTQYLYWKREKNRDKKLATTAWIFIDWAVKRQNWSGNPETSNFKEKLHPIGKKTLWRLSDYINKKGPFTYVYDVSHKGGGEVSQYWFFLTRGREGCLAISDFFLIGGHSALQGHGQGLFLPRRFLPLHQLEATDARWRWTECSISYILCQLRLIHSRSISIWTSTNKIQT